MTTINHTFATLQERFAFDAIIDVRSPSEFAIDHIPGAINCPVLDDEQRVTVGTLYKQVSPFEARKVGAVLVARNIAQHIQTHFNQQPKSWKPLVYCWRGGQRSGAMTHILREVGWQAKRLQGGYKTWRHFVLEQLEQLPPRWNFRVIAGPTGSAKTRILEAMQRQGHQVLNLEALASHKGSVLGALPGQSQPTQKMFETFISETLGSFSAERPVFVESESRLVGQLRLPDVLFQSIRQGTWIHLQVERAQRVAFLMTDYAYFLQGVELERHLDRLKELCGAEQVQGWKELARKGDFATLVDALLTQHYDRHYARSLQRGTEAGSAPEHTVVGTDLSDGGIDALARTIATMTV